MRRNRTLLAVFLLAATLNLIGIGWGLPNDGLNWEQHSPAPYLVLNLLTDLTGYTYLAYSPAYPLMLMAASAPYLAYAQARGDIRLDFTGHRYSFRQPMRVKSMLTLIARLVSVFFSLALLGAVYLLTQELFGRRTALLSTLLLAVYYPFVFLAHSSTPDICATLAAVLALLFTLRCLTRERLSDYVWTSVFAAFAVATKEYLFAAMLPLPLVLLYDLWANHKPGKFARLLGLALPALVVFPVFTGLVYNPNGYFAHLHHYSSGGIFPQPSIPLLHLPAVFGSTINVGMRTFGLPLFALCVAGLVWQVYRPRPHMVLVLLLPMFSFFVFYLNVFNLVIDRYAFFLFALLPIFAADLVARYLWPPDTVVKKALTAVFALLVLFAGWNSVALDLDFVQDARYDAERWLRQHVRCSSSIGIVDLQSNLPRTSFNDCFYPTVSLDFAPEQLAATRPDLVVLNSYAVNEAFSASGRNEGAKPQKRDFLSRLLRGELGYRPVALFRPPNHLRRPPYFNLNQTIVVLLRADLAADDLPSSTVPVPPWR